jgi:hypothetical protein
MNPFAEAMRAMLVDDMHLGTSSVSVLPPVVRRGGDRLEGDMFTSITLTTGMMQARVGFSFDRGFLLQMKNVYFAARRAQWGSMNVELLARHTVVALIEKATPGLIAVFGSPPRVAEISVADISDPVRCIEHSKVPGVAVVLGTDQGRVFISALAPVRAKRGQA